MINLIYDGDIGPDPCDFSTISVLHEYHKREMINLMGVIGVTPDPYLASTFDIYNRLYGHEIPIGSHREDSPHSTIGEDVKTRYFKALAWACRNADPNKVIYEKFGTAHTKTASDVLDSSEMYRLLLSNAADDSVTIYAAGQLYNFEALLRTRPDHCSPLAGKELLARKVKEFVFMGGYFPDSSVNEWYVDNTSGAEWNWWGFGSENTTRTSLEAIVSMGKPVTYVGAEQGVRVLVGEQMAARLGRHHPTTEAFYLSKWLTKENDDGGADLEFVKENPAYDEITLFHVVEDGVGHFFDRVGGSVRVNAHGANVWLPGDTNESYLTIRSGIESELRDVITDRITGNF